VTIRRIVIDELDSVGEFLVCAPEVAVALEGFKLVTVDIVPGGYLLRPRRVGVVRVGDLQVEVAPKDSVGIASVFFLLGYAARPGFVPPDVRVDEDLDLFSAVAEALVRQAERALAGGVHHGYVSVEETSRTIRGRIRMSDQVLRHYGALHPVEVTYDDFSPDVAENRLLLAALRRVEAIPRLPSNIGGRIGALRVFLDGVRELQRGEPLPRWVPTRLNERYHGVLPLAEAILREQSVRPGADPRFDAAGFVVDMEDVFEDFVVAALAEALAHRPGAVETQYKAFLDEESNGGPRVRMAVDVALLRGGKPVALADAKYKAEHGQGKYPNADKYQALAYCTALNVSRAWLVYAQGGRPVERKVKNSVVRLVDWPIDLSLRPSEILEQVAALASDIGAHVDAVSQFPTAAVAS
jgi:5-methylcytosine-specific restriction enzyme subunit McrC